MYDKCYFCLDQLPKLKKESTARFFVNFGGAGVQKSRPTLLYHSLVFHEMWNHKKRYHFPKAMTGSMYVPHVQWFLDEFCNPRPHHHHLHRQQRQNLLWCKFEFAVILVASARGFHGKSNVDIKYPFRGEATIWKLISIRNNPQLAGAISNPNFDN